MMQQQYQPADHYERVNQGAIPDGMTPDQMAQYQDMQGDDGEDDEQLAQQEQQEQLQNQLG